MGLIAFQSTRPVRGGTIPSNKLPIVTGHFNPPAPCGAGLDSIHSEHRWTLDFNPPAPCGAGRRCRPSRRMRTDFNPPAPCGAGPVHFRPAVGAVGISIHPPRAGRDQHFSQGQYAVTVFQSTRPVRGGTFLYSEGIRGFLFQSTRPVRGGTCPLCRPYPYGRISIHPPRAGRDVPRGCCVTVAAKFQSTRPVRGGTRQISARSQRRWISIHPPRAGRDVSAWGRPFPNIGFQSTRPVRGGTRKAQTISRRLIFQSTRPVRGGTSWTTPFPGR